MDRHAIIRTSPKGGPFVGRCMNCGKPNLTLFDAQGEECPNPAGRSQDDTLIAAIRGDEP